MTAPVKNHELHHRSEYDLHTRVHHLRREVFQQADPAARPELLQQLSQAEQDLNEADQQNIAETDPSSGMILDTTSPAALHGLGDTGLAVKVYINLAHLPTAIFHLLDPEVTPLLTCEVTAAPDHALRRVRVTSYIEGYSSQAVNTFELPPGETHTFKQLPLLMLDRARMVTELTRATLHIIVEDLGANIDLHETYPLWLLARTSAPLGVRNPQTGGWQDLSLYLGAFVTPNAQELMQFLREAARQHPDGRLVGYQGPKENVPAQVKAIYNALQTTAGITYVNSLIDFNPQAGFSSQRVRLPRESLEDKEANCIDGTVLFASLLEGISLRPAIELVPGHAFVGWESWPDSGDWSYLETTLVGSKTFEEACTSAASTAEVYINTNRLRSWPLVDLRTKYNITPME